METLLITGALPYSNSPLTLGQLQSIYLPADIYTRFNRLLGNQVLFLCGTDDHGVPITVAADRENLTPEEIISHYHKIIQMDFKKFRIEFDFFSRTHQKKHFRLAQQFFRQLYQNGHLSIQETLNLYCSHCEMFLPDWLVEGQCPHEFCGYPLAYGGECDQCGQDVDPKELVQPRCARCHEPPISRESQHFYFKLSDFEDPLLNWLGCQEHWHPRIHQRIEDWWKTGFRDIAISRDLSWGIPIPVEEEQVSEKVIYVWFEAILGYITASQDWAEQQQNSEAWKSYWTSSDCKLIHFVNKKQIPFHAILWPAVIIAQGEDSGWNLPHNIIVHQPIYLKAEKLSQIESHSIYASQLLANPIFSLDVFRYTLASRLSRVKKRSFTLRELFEDRQVLASGFGNFVHRTLKFILHHFEGKIPPQGSLRPEQKVFIEEAEQSLARMKQAYQEVEIEKVVLEFNDLTEKVNQFFEEEKPFLVIKENREACATIVHIAVTILQNMTIAISPILLESAEQIWKFFGATPAKMPFSWRKISEGCLFQDQLIQNVSPLFPKLEHQNQTKKEDLLLDFELRYLMEDDFLGNLDQDILLDAETQPEKLQLVVGQVLEEEILVEAGKIRYRIDLGLEERWLYLNTEDLQIPSLQNQFLLVAINSENLEWNFNENYGKILVREEDGFPVLLEANHGLKPGVILK